MCSDLKLLYVLATRAKHCVLFYERDPDAGRPMLDVWRLMEGGPLVEVMEMGPQVGTGCSGYICMHEQ